MFQIQRRCAGKSKVNGESVYTAGEIDLSNFNQIKINSLPRRGNAALKSRIQPRPCATCSRHTKAFCHFEAILRILNNFITMWVLLCSLALATATTTMTKTKTTTFAPRPWMDKTKTVDERAAFLLSVLSLEEKVAQMIHVWATQVRPLVCAGR